MLLIALIGCTMTPATSDFVVATRPYAAVPPTPPLLPTAAKLPPLLLHLPGIAGTRSHDLGMVRGVQQGGFTGEVRIYDWTGSDAGLKALLDMDRDKQQAHLVADIITKRFDADPTARIILTGHSGGCGIAIWSLEDLPDRVKVDTVVLLAPALSPGYDLSKALAHVSNRAYVFSSLQDPVLGLGTRAFGTIDGVKTDAGGRVGFTRPANADAAGYDKLVQFPYDSDWMHLDNYGDHIGAMTHKFARLAIAPLILTGKLPTTQPIAATIVNH